MRAVLLLTALLLPGFARAQTLDEADTRLREQAWLRAWTAPLGQAVRWRNPETGSAGSITPEHEHKSAAQLCRDMAERLTLGDTTRHGMATGCRDEDQSWHVVSATPPDAPAPADLPAYQPPTDISADPPRPAQPGVQIWIRPRGPANTAPIVRLTVPPPPTGQE